VAFGVRLVHSWAESTHQPPALPVLSQGLHLALTAFVRVYCILRICVYLYRWSICLCLIVFSLHICTCTHMYMHACMCECTHTRSHAYIYTRVNMLWNSAMHAIEIAHDELLWAKGSFDTLELHREFVDTSISYLSISVYHFLSVCMYILTILSERQLWRTRAALWWHRDR